MNLWQKSVEKIRLSKNKSKSRFAMKILSQIQPVSTNGVDLGDIETTIAVRGPLGLEFETDYYNKHAVIKRINPNGIVAQFNPMLVPGMIIIAINGRSVFNIGFNETMKLLKTSPRPLRLGLRFSDVHYRMHQTFEYEKAHVIQSPPQEEGNDSFTRHFSGKSIGMTLDFIKNRLKVRSIDPGSLASTDCRIKPGLIIDAINNKKVDTDNIEQSISFLKACLLAGGVNLRFREDAVDVIAQLKQMIRREVQQHIATRLMIHELTRTPIENIKIEFALPELSSSNFTSHLIRILEFEKRGHQRHKEILASLQ